MLNDNVVQFSTYRLRVLLDQSNDGDVARNPSSRTSDLAVIGPGPVQDNDVHSRDAALITALVLRFARLKGRSLEAMPRILREALEDLWAEGNPVGGLLWSWLSHQDMSDIQMGSPSHHQQMSESNDVSHSRIFRHRRFWKPDSPFLAKADEKRRQKLQDLVAVHEEGE